MEERRRLSRCFQLLFELIPPSADRDQLVLDVSPANTLHNRFNDFLSASFEPNQWRRSDRERSNSVSR